MSNVVYSGRRLSLWLKDNRDKWLPTGNKCSEGHCLLWLPQLTVIEPNTGDRETPLSSVFLLHHLFMFLSF